MTSKVKICNLALKKIAQGSITSLSDGTPQANACNLLFDEVVEEVISEGHWSSCTFQATLNRTTTTPNHNYSYEFQLPTNPRFIDVIKVQDEKYLDLTYLINSDKLYTSESTIKLTYTGVQPDTTKYSAHLKKCVILKLAAEMAYEFTGSRVKEMDLKKEYEIVLSRALALDGARSKLERDLPDDLIRDR